MKQSYVFKYQRELYNFIIMSRNQQHNSQQSPDPQETVTRNMNWLNNLTFYDKLRYLFSINVSNSQYFKYLSSGHGFVFVDTPQSLGQLQQTVQEIFGVSLNRFNILAKQMNIKIKQTVHKQTQQRKVTYKSKQPIINLDQISTQFIEEQLHNSQDSNQHYQEQLPRIQEAECNIKGIQQKGKRQFIKPNIILNRAYSEGNISLVQSRRSLEDVSIEAKLYEQDFYATPQPIRLPTNFKKQAAQIVSSNCANIEVTSLADRSKLYKQNYDKCSKLIDTTIMELLTAHKSNIIDEQANGLLQKITEIYDMLSDNIENINSTAKCLAKRDMQTNGTANKTVKKEVLEQISSIGFKPLNQEN